MTAGPTIDYDTLAQDAMRGLVRTVLSRAAKTGLPGDHHFYISFDTQAAGVVISKRLKEKYPQEMTIVLQHRFWDLVVTEERFEVKLTFDGIPERLVVPFSAIKVFFDPSVSYGLQFEDPEARGGAGTDGEEGRPTAITTRSSSPRKPRTPRARAVRDGDAGGDRAEPAIKPVGETPTPRAPRPALTPVGQNAGAQAGSAGSLQPATASGQPQPPRAPQAGEGKSETRDKGETREKSPAAADAPIDAANKPAPPTAGAQVVSLDAFRKK